MLSENRTLGCKMHITFQGQCNNVICSIVYQIYQTYKALPLLRFCLFINLTCVDQGLSSTPILHSLRLHRAYRQIMCASILLFIFTQLAFLSTYGLWSLKECIGAQKSPSSEHSEPSTCRSPGWVFLLNRTPNCFKKSTSLQSFGTR